MDHGSVKYVGTSYQASTNSQGEESMSNWGTEFMIVQHPEEWRRVPGYTAYAVNRGGDLVNEFGRVEATVRNGRRSYNLHRKFNPSYICSPSDLILRAFPEVSEEQARREDFIEENLPSAEVPVNKAVPKVTTMEIIVMPPKGPGRVFRGQKPETVVEVIDAVKYGRGFLLEDFESDTAFTYAPGAAALVQTKVEK